jgi:hypothetical protein
MIFRNEKVYAFRLSILNSMARKTDLTQADIRRFKECSYTRMLLMFWKPLDSFYDEEFLQEMEK